MSVRVYAVCVGGEMGRGKTVTARTVVKVVPRPTGRIVVGLVVWQGR